MAKGEKQSMIDNGKGGRAVPEWIGTHPDQKVPGYVRLRIWERQKGMCAITGLKLRSPARGHAALDHEIPLADQHLHPDYPLHRESNLRFVDDSVGGAHKQKTAEENKNKAKANRIKKREAGLHEPKTKLQNKGFDKTAPQTKASRPIEKKQPKTYTDPFAGLPRRVCGIPV